METRSIRTTLSNDGNTLQGYAALYSTPSQLLSERGRKFVEQIAPGAFVRTLKDHPDVTAHWTHDENQRPPLGRTTAGTLRLTSDQTGLRFSLDLPAWANDIKEAVQRGDVDGMSFQFSGEQDSWSVRDGVNYRTLHDLTLHHIALVVRPAYPDAFAEVRSQCEPPELEQNLAKYKAKARLKEIESE